MINTGDTAFVLISAALVMVMTPGLAFFYGGLVRRKNFLAIVMQSFISMGVVTVIWVTVGYSLAFSGNVGGVIGNFSWVLLRGVGAKPGPWAPHIPALAHFVFQEMFAIITPALITGAFADRVHFKSYLKFLVAWSLLVYVPLVHWIWGGGFLAKWGVHDFAGGMVVHASAGFAALAFGMGRRSEEVRSWRKDGSPQRRLRWSRHGIALVRLVRLQRWFRARGERHRRAGLCEHRHRGVGRDVHLARDQLVASAQAERDRRLHGRRRRTGVHHPVCWLRPDVGVVSDRLRGRLSVLRGGRLAEPYEVG